MGWQPISSAPKDAPILVFYDHDADPYRDPAKPDQLTDYACHAENGDFLSGKGIAVAHWCEGYHESEGWESGIEYWMPAVWCAWFNGDFADHVVNPTHWQPLPAPPADREAIMTELTHLGQEFDAAPFHPTTFSHFTTDEERHTLDHWLDTETIIASCEGSA